MATGFPYPGSAASPFGWWLETQQKGRTMDSSSFARPLVVVGFGALLPGEPFLFQTCGFALPSPQEIELGAADVGMPSDLDPLDTR